MLNSKWDLRLYICHMKSNEVGTTLKHPETINDNARNLSKSGVLYKENVTFTLRI